MGVKKAVNIVNFTIIEKFWDLSSGSKIIDIILKEFNGFKPIYHILNLLRVD
jgi:hypothetical protein